MQIQLPKVSIITINFNNRAGLEKTLTSVFEQAFTGFEYIVIDGGSTDGSVELLERYREKFSHCVSEPDRGIYHAMNKGIQAAQGEYLWFMNSGDAFHGRRALADMVAGHDDKDYIYANMIVDHGTQQYTVTFPAVLTVSFLITDCLPHQASLIRKSLFGTVGLYDESLKIASDWKFSFLAITKYGASYQHLDFIPTIYNGEGLSSTPDGNDRLKLEKNAILAENIDIVLEELIKIGSLHDRLCNRINKSSTIRFLRQLGFLSWLDLRMDQGQ